MQKKNEPTIGQFVFREKKVVILILSILALVISGGGVFFACQKKFHQTDLSQTEISTEKNYFEINDETAGVYFHISKKFDRMNARDLQLKNPAFFYGFASQNDESVYCVVSQTKRDKAGEMKVSDLRDGVLDQVKKTFSDANLEEAEIVEVGDNNKGVKLLINYTDNNIPIIQKEVVGITDKMATFAFCVTPKSVVDLYKSDINLFLDSVRIK